NKEADSLRVVSPITDNTGFERVRAHLKTLSPAPTTQEAAAAAKRGATTRRTTSLPPPSGRVDPPSSQYQNYSEGNVFEISVPANWRELSDSNTVTFAPANGYGSYNGSNVYTHGIQFGLQRNASQDLRTATDQLVNALSRGNPKLSRAGDYFNTTIDGRRG